MELWDAYDKDFNLIPDTVLVRGEAVPDGMFHLVCDVIVKHADGEYLLMKRDIRKHLGGMWEATAGGSALRGETPLECVIRELKEETGIKATNITEIGRVTDDKTHSVYTEFLCVTDCDKSSIVLQDGETSDYKWVSKDELRNMKSNELATDRIQRFIEELR